MTSRSDRLLGFLVAISGIVGGCSSAGDSSATSGPSTAGPAEGSQCATAPAPTDPSVSVPIHYATGRRNIEGTWQSGLQASVLTIDVAPSGTSHLEGGTGCGSTLVVDGVIHLATRDGMLSVDTSTLRFDGVDAGFVVPVTLPDAYLHRDPSLAFQPFSWSMVSATTPTLHLVLQSSRLDAYVLAPDG